MRSRSRRARYASTAMGSDASLSAPGSARGPSSSSSVPGTRHTRPVVLSLQAVRCRLALVPLESPQVSEDDFCLRAAPAGKGRRCRSRTLIPSAGSSESNRAKGAKTAGRHRPNGPSQRWRADWQRARPRPWLFPARDQQTPLPATTLPKTFKAVVRQSGLPKDASIHTLRHSYATHLLARGVSLRVIRNYWATRAPVLPPATRL